MQNGPVEAQAIRRDPEDRLIQERKAQDVAGGADDHIDLGAGAVRESDDRAVYADDAGPGQDGAHPYRLP
jgi:hypothetical protein